MHEICLHRLIMQVSGTESQRELEKVTPRPIFPVTSNPGVTVAEWTAYKYQYVLSEYQHHKEVCTVN